MKLLQRFFKTNEWELINEVLENGRVSKNGTTIKWSTLAKKYSIKPEGSLKQQRVASNDVWRRFLKHIQKNNLDLTTVKQTVNGNGDVLFETRKSLPVSKEYSLEGLIIDKVTTNPHGSEWISYKRKKEEVIEQEETILPAMERLFKKYTSTLEEDGFKFMENIIEAEEFFPSPKGRIAILNLYDAHLDKLPVKATCGVESTLQENITVFERTVSKMATSLIGENIEKIILPVGNDLFHTNGFNSQTKKGTQIEYFGSPEDAYYAICDIITQTVFSLSFIAPVEVIMIKGNHDEDKITTLGYWLERITKFSQAHSITVDYLRTQRKYIKYGENLIGFAHGDKEKSKIAQLPLIMAQEAKEMWGTTTYRKMYLGDLHHGFEYQFLKAKDMPGVEVEYLRSVGTTDTWHQDFGWVGVPKTAYIQIFDKEEGEVNRMKFNIK